MSFLLVTTPATIEVPTYKDLLAAWRLYGPGPIVGRFIVEKPLTEAQLRRLPAELRSRLD